MTDWCNMWQLHIWRQWLSVTRVMHALYRGHDFAYTRQNDTYVWDVSKNISILHWPSTKESTNWPPLICPRGVVGTINHSTLLSCYVSLPSKFARTYFVGEVCKTDQPLNGSHPRPNLFLLQIIEIDSDPLPFEITQSWCQICGDKLTFWLLG